MKRREFITLMGGAAMSPLAARAQSKVRRVGFLWDSPGVFPEAMEAFRHELRKLGYVEGRNIVLEYRWAEGDLARMREMAEELVRLNVDVIVAPSSVYTAAAKGATSTIPVVFFSHADPLGSGHVSSLAHPGGNITGISDNAAALATKRLALIKQAVN